MTTCTKGTIGREELKPEPCDGTGDDAMSNRLRNKWLRAGVLRREHIAGAASQLSGLEELQPEPSDGTGKDATSTSFHRILAASLTHNAEEVPATRYGAFGVWMYNQRAVDWEAQRLFARWQRSRQAAPPILLTDGALGKIASAAVARRLSTSARARDILELCTISKEFHLTLMRKLEACNAVKVKLDEVIFTGSHAESGFKLDMTTFYALHEHTPITFPEVTLERVRAEDAFVWELTGIERLDLLDLSGDVNDSQSLIRRNEDSLKVLSMPESMLTLLPSELKLEEFVMRANPNTLKVPLALNTKVFKCSQQNCSCSERAKIPPAFIRTVNADEIHLDVNYIEPNAQDTPASEPTNSRLKKLTFDIKFVAFSDFHFDRIIRDVTAVCPALEFFEVVYNNDIGGNNDVDFLRAQFEHAVEVCSAPFSICLKAFFNYASASKSAISDFVRLRFNVDLPPACCVHDKEGLEHYHIVKETLFENKSLRMDFRISVDSWGGPTNGANAICHYLWNRCT